MNTEIKAQWVAALRSGEYKQTRGRLRNGDAFCCLGVLCNLHAQAHPEIAAKEIDCNSYLGVEAALPKAVRSWAKLQNPLGDKVIIGAAIIPLSGHNDEGCNFAEIADAIEEQL